MIKILIFYIAIMVVTPAVAQTSLEVTVTGFADQVGRVRVGLFSDARNFLKEVVEGKDMALTGGPVTVVFEDLPPGEYAISVFHDRNANGRLDTNVLGIPREGFAFGNNALGVFGPPSFEKAKVVLGKTPLTQVVRLKYF